MTSKLNELLDAVNKELERSRVNYEHTKKSAREVAASAALSPSQSGDMFHAQGTADLAKQKFDSILSLKEEIEEKGEQICCNLNGEELFLVENPVIIKGFKLISNKSPIGQKLLHDKTK